MRGINRSTIIKIALFSRVITTFHNSRFSQFVECHMKQRVIPTRYLDLIGDRDDDKKEMRRQPESICRRQHLGSQ